MFTNIRFPIYLVILMNFALPSEAQPVHQLYSGRITNLLGSASGNMAFRVTLSTTLTGCSGNMAYIEPTHSNYAAYVSTLTTAAASGKITHIWVTAQPTGFCTLDELSIDF